MNLSPLLGSPLQHNLDDTASHAARLQLFAGLIGVFVLLAVGSVGVHIVMITARRSGAQALLALGLFVAALAAITIGRTVKTRRMVLGAAGAAAALALVLNAVTRSDSGNTIFYLLIALAVYRLDMRWSIPVAVASGFALLFSNGLDTLVGIHLTGDSIALVWNALIVYLCVLVMGGSLRARYLLIARLQETQRQLQMEIERTAELATARERTRIARDIHDVLAHSLTVLSVQVQATRTLQRQQPERAAALLDEMATLLRESLTESRRVVGLLREVDPAQAETGALGVRLHAQTETFGERTGMRCTFDEIGMAQPVSGEIVETLRSAQREALTNAYRHGAARHVWVELRWREASELMLLVHDDGRGMANGGGSGSGNGLRGMRERVSALGGGVRAEPQAEGGFVVEITLPIEAAAPKQTPYVGTTDVPVAEHGAA